MQRDYGCRNKAEEYKGAMAVEIKQDNTKTLWREK